MSEVLVIVEKARGNYAAYSPDVPGCITTGRTKAETLRNIREALSLHLEDEPELRSSLDCSHAIVAYVSV